MASLVLGAFQMIASDGSARVMAEGTSWGSPVPIEVAINSFLQDGAIVVTQGHDNREVDVKIRFYGDNLTALNAKEALLFAELEKPNTLTWTPDNGPATVFVVVTSSLVQNDESFVGEVQGDPWRTYNVRLVCEAFTRSVSETVATALAADGTTTTLVNNGSATTNWTGSVSAGTLTGPTVVGGTAVKVGTTAVLYGAVTTSATLTTSITTSSTKYLDVDWKPEVPHAGMTTVAPLRAFGDGVELDRTAERLSPTAGYVRTTFYVAASSIAALRLDSYTFISDAAGHDYDGSSPQIRSLTVDNINRTDIKPSLGTSRQLLRSLIVAGSARAQASLAVEHATNALGDVMVFVYPTSAVGYQPALRPYRVAGGAVVTADATLVSGSRDAINGATSTYDVPLSQIVSGMHLLAARISSTSHPPVTVTLSWTASTRIGSTQIGSTTSGSQVASTLIDNTYSILALANISLPTVDAASDSASTVVRITITATSAQPVNLDDAWLFNRDIGYLVGPVGCGTAAAAAGGPARRLFIEPPSVGIPRPRVLIGHSSDRSDAFFPVGALGGWDVLKFPAGSVNVFTVTTNTTDASVTLRHYPRWHTNAGS